MTTESILSLAIILFSICAYAMVNNRAAPYGRHMSRRYGPNIGVRTGWVLMEIPAVIGFLLPVLFISGHNISTSDWILATLWLTHYLHRSFIYPFSIKARSQSEHKLLLVVVGGFFNGVCGYAIALSLIDTSETERGMTFAFFVGLALFIFGAWLNKNSDAILRRLRESSPEKYAIPEGGAFRFVSCPNYLGELIQWFGYAIASGTLASAAYFIYSASNLIPRAASNHKWYRKEFPDYPDVRTPLVPSVKSLITVSLLNYRANTHRD